MQTTEIDNVSVEMTELTDLGESINKMKFHKDMLNKYVEQVARQVQGMQLRAKLTNDNN